MSLMHLLRYGFSLSPDVAARKALTLVRNKLTGTWRSLRFAKTSTYTALPVLEDQTYGLSALSPGTTIRSTGSEHTIGTHARLLENYAAHTFDLLGSGWVCVNAPPHLQNPSVSKGNHARATKIASMIGSDYDRINWHSDFLSGFHWRSDKRSETLLYGHKPGVDIKVPWELARLQHLPQLALFKLLRTEEGKPGSIDIRLEAEFQNQCLDFMASNPPGYGVNWVCTMDVAIRAANLILAFELFRNQGHSFSRDFVNEFIAAVEAHGVHITENLEWHEGFRGNHYLADVTGLLFIASFLPSTPRTDRWLAFAVHEFIKETRLQFNPDGSNAEASTSYHRLSAETVVYGTALVLGLCDKKRLVLEKDYQIRFANHPPRQIKSVDWNSHSGPFDPDHFGLLQRMAEFTKDVTKPDGHIAQIGDNDNGRFFKLSPVLFADTIEEDHLDHRHLINGISTLLDATSDSMPNGPALEIEQTLIYLLKGKSELPEKSPSNTSHTQPTGMLPSKHKKATRGVRLIITPETALRLSGLSAKAYPDFGLYIWRSDQFFLSVRCGSLGQGGNGGHAHNDQLSIELQIDREDWLRDPGSATYTADTSRRDQYRSHLAHTGPRLFSEEPSRMDLGLFRLENNANATCLQFDEHEFLGMHTAYEQPVFRHIALSESHIVITDCLGGWDKQHRDLEEIRFTSAADLQSYFNQSVPFSRGYGLPRPA